MRRRDFFSSVAAGGAVAATPASLPAQAPGKRLGISAVEFWRVEGEVEVETMSPRQSNLQPIHIYDEHRPKPVLGPQTVTRETRRQSRVYLRIGTDGGVEGFYGPIDNEVIPVVERQLKGFLMGKDALAGEAMWDKMFRLNRHSRRGHFMMAISAVDNALWDLRGRYFNAPVYRLLGGPTRPEIQAYGSTLGHSLAPEPLREKCVEFKKQGFVHQKWFVPYGPGDGGEGLKKNVEIVRNLREALGYEADIMFDAFSGWDLNYAISWAKQVEQYRPRWIEEAFHPDKIDSFAILRRSTSIPVASGEHFYNRWETHDYLKADALAVVQADPEWCGGVSELVKICTTASLHDVQVIPHGHSVHAALHVVASQSPMTCPLVEYLIDKMRSYYVFEKDAPHPAGGKIALSDRPGFGIELDDAKVEKRSLVEFG